MKTLFTSILTATYISGALIATQVLADGHGQHKDAQEKAKHFAAKPAPDVNTALCHLEKYNAILSDVAAGKTLDAVAMNKIHELTYTLENALARLNTTLAATAIALEEVHLASERMDQDVVKAESQKYFVLLASLTEKCRS